MALAGGLGAAVVLALILTITRSIEWVRNPLIWLVFGGVVGIGYYVLRGESYRAGAEWLAIKNEWVRTYELVEVTAQTSGSGIYLTLRDSDGRKLEFKYGDLVSTSRVLYDLTYNGILYSVIAGGAETNRLLHRTLKLPYPASARGSHDDEDSAG